MKLRNLIVSFGMLGLISVAAFAQPKLVKDSATYTPASSGAEMYSTYCAVCHGTAGKGDGPAASALKKAPADLTQLTAKNGGKFPQARVALYINGDENVTAHGTRDMPVWGSIFRRMDSDVNVRQIRINVLIAYLKGLQGK